MNPIKESLKIHTDLVLALSNTKDLQQMTDNLPTTFHNHAHVLVIIYLLPLGFR